MSGIPSSATLTGGLLQASEVPTQCFLVQWQTVQLLLLITLSFPLNRDFFLWNVAMRRVYWARLSLGSYRAYALTLSSSLFSLDRLNDRQLNLRQIPVAYGFLEPALVRGARLIEV